VLSATLTTAQIIRHNARQFS